eukprot:TRINITY_DN3291_c0_g1_i2.p1 TRINITY_DN3291_c0_g1~~TRINITY_DN3291_c0_g1_i2.p1  ORF type:complete len:110 (+),score=12.35 TRINITY_DN3291_c0_g1_i2:20-349(+)
MKYYKCIRICCTLKMWLGAIRMIILNEYNGDSMDIERGLMNISLYSLTTFKKMIQNCDFMAILAIFAPAEQILMEKIVLKNEFILDIRKFKKSLISEVTKTWNKVCFEV